jgi:hypothetical protein
MTTTQVGIGDQVSGIGSESPLEAKQRLGVATGAALLVAGIILVTIVLPAEFAVDPLGTGAKLGLLDLGATGKQVAALESAKSAGTGQGAIVAAQEKPFNHEDVTFNLAPHEGFEYKYRLDKGEALLYSWKADAPVNYELHAEPDGAPKGYAQSYEKKSAMSAASGTLTAPFAGIHGWYWENTTDKPITLTLSSAGFYNIAHEFRDNQPTKNKMFQ